MNAIGYLGRTPLGDLYKCHYTGHIAIEKYFTLVGSVLPQSPVAEAMFTSDLLPEISKSAKQKRKQSFAAFHEMDANCNACKHFKRLQADNKKGSSSASNFVYGDCSNPKAELEKIPYKREGFHVMCHVDDYMGMNCWEPR